MPLNENKRLFWAVQGVGFAPDGSTTFTEAHGLQQLGVSTTFNLTEIFEIGQSSIYDNVEDAPDVEVTAEKVLDGYPLIYHLATPQATNPSLIGRSNERVSMALSIFGDTQDSASGTPNSQMVCSGLYVSSLGYNFPADDNHTESVTLVGNDKRWLVSGFTFTGAIFDNTDVPASGIQRRQNIVMGNSAGASVWPNDIPGIVSGFNLEKSDGSSYTARIQNVSISTDLGREQLVELGRRNPFFRYATFPVEVTCDIEVLSSDGDLVSATEEGIYAGGTNLQNQEIVVKTNWGDVYNLGAKNKLSSTQFSISTDGSNNIDTFSYSNFNELTILSLADPAGL